MRPILSLSTFRRRAGNGWVVLVALVAGIGLGAALFGVVASAREAQQPAPRTFTADAGMIFNPIKPDKTADFEAVMAKLKEALAKSEKPERKQQAVSWKVLKAAEPGPNGSVLYIFVMDPAVKNVDYTVSLILNEAFPAEVQDLYKKFSEAYAGGQSMLNLSVVQTFAQ